MAIQRNGQIYTKVYHAGQEYERGYRDGHEIFNNNPAVQLPDAVAPTITISGPTSVNELTQATFTVTPRGGTYDGRLSYRWSSLNTGGGISRTSGNTATFQALSVSRNQSHTIRCIVTARGTGTNAEDGTSDTNVALYTFTIRAL